ncbi:hypothetical protein QA601_14000 [Chitinispirillales bacterium ANBcel5]|uniref:immunoglobulin domain-containing protein n=1 Tax=Cellulosispirillum alkaliphilum TaxID=3039283 RepID=UPI002A52EC58|nr:hypothetical protein [Chitinispirillales bacterium ANBcel5]
MVINNLFKLNLLITLLLVFPLVFVSGTNADIRVTAIGDSPLDTERTDVSGERIYLFGGGSGIKGEADTCIFANGFVRGDFELKIENTAIVDHTRKTTRGLMVRADTVAQSAMLALLNGENGLFLTYRTTPSGIARRVQLCTHNYSHLKIERKGDTFSLFYKSAEDSAYIQYSTNYTIPFPLILFAGVTHASKREDVITESRYSSLSGLLSGQIEDCQSTIYDFESAESFEELGFVKHQYWELCSLFAYTTTPGGGEKAILKTEPTIISPYDSVTVSWLMNITGEEVSGSELEKYSLIGKNGVTIGDRVNIEGKGIGSGPNSPILVGNDVELTSFLESGLHTSIGHRSTINGDVYCADTIYIEQGVVVDGDVHLHYPVSVPEPELVSVPVGTLPITVWGGDTVSIPPGTYGSFEAFAGARIRFSSGVYNFSHFRLHPDIRIHIDLDDDGELFQLNTRDELRFADRTEMIVNDSTHRENVTFYTRQTNDVEIGTYGNYFGYVIAPRAKVILYSGGTYHFGGIYAKHVNVQPMVNLYAKSVTRPRSDSLTLVFHVDGEDPDYSIQYEFDEEADAEFELLHGDSVIEKQKISMGSPLNRDLNFMLDLQPGSNSSFSYSLGYGYGPIFSNIHFGTEISALSIEYSTGADDENRTINLKDFRVSCTREICEPAVVISQPQNKEVFEGKDVQFEVKLQNPQNYSYQWYKDSVLIPGAVYADYTIRNVDTTLDQSRFYCRVESECDTIYTIEVELSVHKCRAPSIIYKDSLKVVGEGQSVHFSVIASGLNRTYQWFRNGVLINGSNSAQITVPEVHSFNHNDLFTVEISNSCGEIESEGTRLVVLPHLFCEITTHPVSDTLFIGETALFSIETDCEDGEFSWFRNGIEIPGVNTPALLIDSVTIADSGSVFKCVATSGATTDTSRAAVLHVVRPSQTNRMLAISGQLREGSGRLVGGEVMKRFMVRLFTAKTDGTEVYKELSSSRGVLVREGQFTIVLGRGLSEQNLQTVLSSYRSLFAEVSVISSQKYEILGPRIELSTSPYAFKTGGKIIYGQGNPNQLSQNAPLGTMYVDEEDHMRTWKKVEDEWILLD